MRSKNTSKLSTKKAAILAPSSPVQSLNGGNGDRALELTPSPGLMPDRAKALCIVGIGGSVSRLESLTGLLEHLPEKTGMAFLFVPSDELTDVAHILEVLSKTTAMPVLAAAAGMSIEPDRVYVLSSLKPMILSEGKLVELKRPSRGPFLFIDMFFRAIAQERRRKAIGIVLSGAGSDGALGIQSIKAEGGVTFAEEPKLSWMDAMPQSAIATGCIDFVKSVEDIADELVGLGRELHTAYRKHDSTVLEQEDDLKRIFALIRAVHDVDFTFYRHTTIKRRIVRRMVLCKMQNVKAYIQYLQECPAEVEALYQDILIKVTHFFRDPETFDVLTEEVFPALLKARSADVPIRIWVPGCSTGEEAYSLAICLLELLSEQRLSVPIQIFATDIGDAALEKARTGIYVENIAMDVSAERLRRFFSKMGKYYQISKSIRDICIFAKQNVTRDPPFSKLDLISCRNVLIYFEPVLQKRVLPMFHYALKPTGFLVLGASETVGGLSELFTLIDKKTKIHAKSSSSSHVSFEFAGGHYGLDKGSTDKPSRKVIEGHWGGADMQKEADRLTLNRYAPAGVLVNEEFLIVQFRGHTGDYLEPAPGEASLNLLKMAREGLAFELRGALHKAKRTDAPVRVEGIRIRSENDPREIAVEVIPLRQASQDESGLARERWYLVLFEETSRPSRVPAKKAKPKKTEPKGVMSRQLANLEKELATTREYLQAIIEEQEATNEELQSANEELLSSNEELQSINEELETAKEELQSTNEELTTVNEELEHRNAELSQLNNDLINLIASVNIPIVMLSSDLRIRRFTPLAENVLNVIPSDLGRPIGDIKPKIDAPDLERLITEVIDTVAIRECEVRDRDGRWYSMRIRPYRTMDNKIDGAVICLVDIDGLKQGLGHSEGRASQGAEQAS